MNKELKIILVCSVIFCLFFMAQLSHDPSPAIDKQLFSGVASWQAPVFRNASAEDASSASLANPLAARFFESATLKGFIRNAENEWCAVFNTPNGEARIIEPGVGKGGLTLISSNGRFCRVKFGSVIREFKL